MGLVVSDEHIRSLERFAIELKKWNKKINLTAMTADDDIAIKHLLDSIVVAEWVRGAGRVLDIGSGAGIPAMPLKVLLPETKFVSVDAVEKKILFQRHVVRILGLQGYEALHSRVEGLRDSHPGYFDVIISRAFSNLEMFVDLATPLLAEGGRMIAMKGPAVEEEILEGTDYIQRNGFQRIETHTYVLPRNKGERRLVIISASKTP
jgi:16S rRNA (guanine527-N7)-methyltransferase